ncbi:MAG: AMP-binding protein, partial [Calditrichia bacterium]
MGKSDITDRQFTSSLSNGMKAVAWTGSLSQQFGDYPAVISLEEILSFRELESRISGLQSALSQMFPQNTISILSHNSKEYLLILLGAWSAGKRVLLLNTRWKPPQIESALRQCNCRDLLVSRELMNLPFSPKINIREWGNFFRNLPAESAAPLKMLDDMQEATIIFTSGSTSTPKAVLHTIGNHYYSAAGSNQNIRVQPGDRWLLSLPLYHAGGLGILFRCLYGGGAVAVPEPEQTLENSLSQLNPTHISLVPTQLLRLLKMPGSIENLQKMKAILVGGGVIPPSLIRRAASLQLPLFCSYGSSEMASQVTATRPGEPEKRLMTAGKL